MKIKAMKCLTIVGLFVGGANWLAADVQLDDLGERVKLDNGLLSMIISKKDATILSIKKNDTELLMPPDSKGRGKGYIQRHPLSGYTIPKVDKYSVYAQAADMVDLSFYQNNDDYPWIFDAHYVLRSGVSGFYNYIILQYDKGKVLRFVKKWRPMREKEKNVKLDPEAFALGQCNLCLRMNQDVFTHAAVSDERQARIITEGELKDAEKIMDATYRLKDGRIFTKYNWCVREDRHRLHGVMGNGFGAWIIQGTNEHLNGGPYHQELTTHNGILLRHFIASHFGASSPVMTPEDDGWAKLGGPWFVYINTGASNKALWTDGKKKADEYLAQWPCRWLKHPLYPLDRGKVAGRLTITDGTNPAGSLVILAQPPHGRIPEWQEQGRDHFFWSWVKEDGTFEIDKVRANTYTIYILNDKLMGEFRYDGVKVEVNRTTDVGILSWKPDVRGTVLWEIGVPDRTSGEFRHGDEPRQYGRWLRYPSDFPNDVVFEIGNSSEHTDWNYVHTPYFRDDKWHLPEWKVVFYCGREYKGKAYLRVGIAGATIQSTRPEAWVGVDLMLNGVEIGDCRFKGSDSSTPRGGTQGRYRERLVEFDAAHLKKGKNVLTLRFAASLHPSRFTPYPFASLQYDCIRLEVDEADR